MTDPADPSARQPRVAMLAKAQLSKGAGHTSQVLVRNVSRQGLAIKCTTVSLAAGDVVTIDLPPIGRMHGIVRWVRNDVAGIRLDQEIDPAQLLFGSRESIGTKAEPFRVHDRFQPEKNIYRPGFHKR
ncbi:PilZ domain-containing protein [Sphingobium sp. H39-3-25]|nr:PilZ domain-containing protein [Sphingobium arseniciresistens]